MKSKETYLEEIAGLSSYEEGWDGYDSPVPNQYSIDKAREYVDWVLRCPYQTKFLPSADGGVGFSFVGKGNRRGCIEILNEPSEGVTQWLLLYSRNAAMDTISLPIHDEHKYPFMEVLNVWLNTEK